MKLTGSSLTMAKPHTFTVTLLRDGPRTPWGFRLTGGADLGTPFVIIRAQMGSPSEGHLKRGDFIRKIGDYDARDLRHEDAQTLCHNAGNTISMVVERHSMSGSGGAGGSATLPRSRTQPLPNLSRPYSPAPQTPTSPFAPSAGAAPPASAPRPPVAGGVPTPFAAATLPRSPAPGSGATPRKELPVVFPPPLPDRAMEEDINNQPYRTTPLVLPGAKMKKDALPTESYLRHHPNPKFRAPPSHYDPLEAMMKQKVADTVLQKVVGEDAAGKQVVHKQFNSPIGLYSDQNIAETIQSQTGITPPRSTTLDRRNQVPVSMKKTYVYDPLKSETFKALKEAELGDTIQEVTVPVQPKVFSPNKNVAFKKQASSPHQTYVNSLGNMEEKIQQSGSFRRLMNQVLGESDY